MREYGEIAERLRRSTVQVFSQPGAGTGSGSGSGVVWDAAGLILTNAHVLRSSAAEVELWDGRRVGARILARDTRRDLASLRIRSDGLHPAPIGDSSAVRPGELAIAVGSPLGFAGALSTGVIHSVGALPGMGPNRWIRAGLQLLPGNSGGPLANARGEVIGINTAILHGLGVAVPSAAAIDFLRRGPLPALGAVLRPVQVGLEILELDPQGAGAAASLRPGDVLLGGFDTLNDALDSGREVLRLPFFRGDWTRVRRAFVRLQASAGAAA